MSAFAETFAALKVRFLARCAADRAALEAHLAGPPMPAGELRLILHRLAGAAGTFGLSEVSALAGAAEDACLERAPDTDARIRGVIAALASCARQSA